MDKIMNKSKKENEDEKIIELAIEMIKNRDSIDAIAKRCSLPINVVEKIREENNL